jgi:uncharacterized membrane protein YgaE (UPF0421/DUF939 family)
LPDEPKTKPAVPQAPDHLAFPAAAMVSIRAAISAVLAVLVCRLFGLSQPVWAAVSAVVVSQASLHPSARDSLNRVLANLIGAGVGAVVGGIGGNSLWALAIGVILTGLACHFTRLEAALRPAYAAVVIVMFTTNGGAWHESLNRVIAVTIGCASTLLIALTYSKLSPSPPPAPAPPLSDSHE